MWPLFAITSKTGSLAPDFFKEYCVPLAQAVVGKEAEEADVERVALLANRKKGKEAKDRRVEILIHRRLQRFHTSLALVWSLAQ